MLLTELSNRTYNLRNRARAASSATLQHEQVPNEPPSPLGDNDQSPSEVVVPQNEGSILDAEATRQTRLYSDVAASRPPSPRWERPTMSSGEPIPGPDRSRAADRSSGRNNVRNNIDSEESSPGELEEVETPDKLEYWTTVQRRRARSDGSLPIRKPLTSEQTQAVKDD